MGMKIGTLVDRYFAARAERLELEREVAKRKAKEQEWGDKLREAMNAEKTDKASSESGSVSLKTIDVARVEDWDALYEFIVRRKAPHLLYRRVNDANLQEMLEHDAKLRRVGVPGVRWETAQKMTATAARR